MDRRTGFRNDPEFATGWIIFGAIVLVLALVLAATVWATGSWVVGLVVTAVVGAVLATCT